MDTSTPPTIGLLSDSVIRDDPRVRRQGNVLAAAGFSVLAVGLPGGRSAPPDWPIHTIDAEVVAKSGTLASQGRVRRKATRLADLARMAIRAEHAYDVYWRLSPRFAALRDIARQQTVDLWIANDWSALPIVRQLQAETGVRYGYDTHELAVDEYAHSLRWRIGQRPIIAAIELAGIAKSAFVTCVSDGIAEQLQRFHSLADRPHVIRNMPPYQAATLQTTGDAIGILYHGVVAPGRALEQCIASVALWRPEFRLTVRGPGEPDYLQHLARLVAQSSARDRITISPPVPMTELVTQAKNFDIGLFVIDGHSRQNKYVLPNKFFEYMMAGLALCVSDLPEMRKLVRSHEVGALVGGTSPAAIAQSVNALDARRIDEFKANSLAAARHYCWEHEGAAFVRLARAALENKPRQQYFSGPTDA
jgi:glycosyltransferase involved in cell wall biosynthesis